jgi:hypothetical protein
MKSINKWLFATVFIVAALSAFGQQKQKKIWVSGAARGILYGDDFDNQSESDTTTARKTQSGHALVDLGVNIQPSDKILIQSMVRVRNDYGGFWGSGVTLDLRQLYIQGIIGGFLKYELGDINYKLSSYTFQNNVGLINKNKGLLTGISQEQVQYDLFYYPDQSWRQQGAAVDFALEFKSFIKEMDFNLFTTRIRPFDGGTQDDRLYSGGSVVLKQGKYLNLGAQFASLYDFAGTSNSTVHMSNPVYSFSAEVMNTFGKTKLNLALETGNSSLRWKGSEEAPELNDFFYDVSLKAAWEEIGIDITAGYREVGQNFRSAGAQTVQVNYDSYPLAYDRIGNDQVLRNINMYDLYRDASLYNTQIQEGLMNYDPRYDNVTPFGRATPNRRGFSLLANYADKNKRWELSLDGEYLNDIVGEGTTALRDYMTGSAMLKLGIAQMLGLKDRDLWISGRYGMQNTTRNGEQTFEEVDLKTNYFVANVLVTLFGDLDLIGEYRNWTTVGNEMLAERDVYSQIIDYNRYNIDYQEDLYGAGLQYGFSEEIKLSLMYLTFNWEDSLEATQNYKIDSWNLIFAMKF